MFNKLAEATNASGRLKIFDSIIARELLLGITFEPGLLINATWCCFFVG